MTITPGTPDDWTDTVEPKRAEAFVEYLSRDIGYNLRHYVVNVPLARRMPTDNQIAELARIVHERDRLRAEVGA